MWYEHNALIMVGGFIEERASALPNFRHSALRFGCQSFGRWKRYMAPRELLYIYGDIEERQRSV